MAFVLMSQSVPAESSSCLYKPSFLTDFSVVDDFPFLYAQLSKEEGKEKKKRSLEEEQVKEKKEEQTEKALPVHHLQGQKKKSYTLVQTHSFL